MGRLDLVEEDYGGMPGPRRYRLSFRNQLSDANDCHRGSGGMGARLRIPLKGTR